MLPFRTCLGGSPCTPERQPSLGLSNGRTDARSACGGAVDSRRRSCARPVLPASAPGHRTPHSGASHASALPLTAWHVPLPSDPAAAHLNGPGMHSCPASGHATRGHRWRRQAARASRTTSQPTVSYAEAWHLGTFGSGGGGIGSNPGIAGPPLHGAGLAAGSPCPARQDQPAAAAAVATRTGCTSTVRSSAHRRSVYGGHGSSSSPLDTASPAPFRSACSSQRKLATPASANAPGSATGSTSRATQVHASARDSALGSSAPGGLPPQGGPLLRHVRTWRDAAAVTELWGGPDGAPPPRLQLQLLKQSAAFTLDPGDAVGQAADGADAPGFVWGAGGTGGSGGKGDKGEGGGGGGSSRGSRGGGSQGADGHMGSGAGRGSLSIAGAHKSGYEGGAWTGEKEGEKEEGAGSWPSSAWEDGAGEWEALWASGQLKDLMLPGFDQGGSTVDTGGRSSSSSSSSAVGGGGQRVASIASAQGSDGQFTGHSTIGHLQPHQVALVSPLTPILPPDAGAVASISMRQQAQQRQQEEEQRPPRSVVEDRPILTGSSPPPELQQHHHQQQQQQYRHKDSQVALAARVLAAVVHDAAREQPGRWTADQVAQLLLSAACLSRRFPTLLLGEQGAQRQQQNELDGMQTPAHGDGAASNRATRPGRGGGSSGSRPAALLRMELQQLLLRLDGFLPAPTPTPTSELPSHALGKEGAQKQGSALQQRQQQQQQQLLQPAALSPSGAVCALWAAAVLRLRLSADGQVQRGLRRLPLVLPPPQRGPAAAAELIGDGGGAEAPGDRVRGAGGGLAALPAARLADLLWGAAQVQMQVSRPWLVAVCLALAPRLTELPPALVAAAAWGAVELWEATAAGAAAAAGRATAKGMGSSKSSVSEEPSAGGAQPQPEGQGQGGVPGEARLPAAWASGVFAATEGRLGALSDTQLVALLWTVSRLRRRPGGPWQRCLAAALAARADRLRPAQMARAVTAMAKMRTALPYKLVRSLLQSFRRQLADASAADVASLLWALRFVTQPYTQLVVRLHRRLLRDLAAAVLPSLEATAAAAASDAEPDSEHAPPPAQRTSPHNSFAPIAAQPGGQPSPSPLPYDGWAQGAPLSVPLTPAMLPPELLGPGQLVQLADGLAHLGLLPGAEWMRRHREACLAMRERFPEANRRKIRQAYAIMWQL